VERSDLSYILEAELIIFADVLYVDDKEKQWIKDSSQVFGLSNQVDGNLQKSDHQMSERNF